MNQSPTRAALSATSLLLAMLDSAAAADALDVFEARVYRSAEGETLPYRLMLPAEFDRERKYPLVLFLHGAGERGTDNSAQLVHGMNDFAKDENRKRYQWFVVAPQCPEGKRWVEVEWTLDSHEMPAEPSEPLALVLELLDDLAREYRIDADRIYVTGLSMGGFGVWDLVQRFPERFAAAAPVCAGGDEEYAPRIAKIPVWAFHGALDDVVKPARSQNMLAAMRQAGGKPRYTEYPDVAHDSWKPAYADPELLAWLSAQRRPKQKP